MKQYMIGFDEQHPRRCAEYLYEKGIRAVVLSHVSPEISSVLSDTGINIYLSFGALSLNQLDPDKHGARNTDSEITRWFSSGCPNDDELAESRITRVLDRTSQTEGVCGIFVDGARFASFASPEGADAFFTCFCPRCMEKMEQMGLDSKAIRTAAKQLRTGRIDHSLLNDWLTFREVCVAEYFRRFADRVHAQNPDLAACAFVFAPSLGRFVGQTMKACAPLDVVAPMLYRHYPHELGPACLGHEWASLFRMFGSSSLSFMELANAFAPGDILTENSWESAAEYRIANGFSPEWIRREVSLAKSTSAPHQALWPVIQLEDELRESTRQHAFDGGADCVGYFMYGQEEL